MPHACSDTPALVTPLHHPQMYLFCLFMRVLLSWFPGIDWNAQPWTFLRLVRGSMGLRVWGGPGWPSMRQVWKVS